MINFSKNAKPILKNNKVTDDHITFINVFDNWIHSSQQIVTGLSTNKYIVSGITDAFNQTYVLYNKIGVFPGEYGYHKLVIPDRITENLSQADIIIISHPFSADGMCSKHLIEEADSYDVPIFVDCAFFGICSNINFDFSQFKNIKSICFSLSKSIGTGLYRIGLLYTNDFYPVSVYETWEYPLYSSVDYHLTLINKISPDYNVLTFKNKQLKICKQYDLIPSDTVIFGLDYTEKYIEYKRGNVNRLTLPINNIGDNYGDND